MAYSLKFYERLIYTLDYLNVFDIYAFSKKRQPKSFAVILGYHRVSDSEFPWSLTAVDTRTFEDQIRYLAQSYNILPLEEIATYLKEGKSLPPKTVAVTFDDGYKCVYKKAYPILKKYDTPATVFLTTGPIGDGRLFWWDLVRYAIYHTSIQTLELENLGTFSLDAGQEKEAIVKMVTEKLIQLANKDKNKSVEEIIEKTGVDTPLDLGKKLILNWDEIYEMAENNIDFGAHTVTHPLLSRLRPKEVRDEVTQSKRQIERSLGKPVTTFAYPYGGPDHFNPQNMEVLKESGFTCAVTCIPTIVKGNTNPYKMGRVLPEIKPNCDLEKFKLMLLVSEAYSDICSAVSKFKRKGKYG